MGREAMGWYGDNFFWLFICLVYVAIGENHAERPSSCPAHVPWVNAVSPTVGVRVGALSRFALLMHLLARDWLFKVLRKNTLWVSDNVLEEIFEVSFRDAEIYVQFQVGFNGNTQDYSGDA